MSKLLKINPDPDAPDIEYILFKREIYTPVYVDLLVKDKDGKMLFMSDMLKAYLLKIDGVKYETDEILFLIRDGVVAIEDLWLLKLPVV